MAAAALADPQRPGAVRPRHRRGRRHRRRRRRLPRPQPAAVRRAAPGGDGWRAPSTPRHRWSRCGRRSPSICAAPRGAAHSGSGWTRAAPRWSSWRPATSIPATRANPTTPTGTEWPCSPSPSTSAAPRSPPGSSIPPARWCTPSVRPTPKNGGAGSGLGRGRGRRSPTRCARPTVPSARWASRRPARSICTSGTVSPINIACWREFPLRDRVAAAVPGVPVRLGGDGVCMALGEHWRGAGRGARFLLGMVVSTGVGGGLVLDGAPYGGRTGNAGHVGHVVVDPDGAPCCVRWPRLRRDRRVRSVDGAVGAGQRLGRLTRCRRDGTGRRGGGRRCGGACGRLTAALPRSRR